MLFLVMESTKRVTGGSPSFNKIDNPIVSTTKDLADFKGIEVDSLSKKSIELLNEVDDVEVKKYWSLDRRCPRLLLKNLKPWIGQYVKIQG